MSYRIIRQVLDFLWVEIHPVQQDFRSSALPTSRVPSFFAVGASWALSDVEQHPWLYPHRCQKYHPLSLKMWQPTRCCQMSPGGKTLWAENRCPRTKLPQNPTGPWAEYSNSVCWYQGQQWGLGSVFPLTFYQDGIIFKWVTMKGPFTTTGRARFFPSTVTKQGWVPFLLSRAYNAPINKLVAGKGTL